jgi:hypothetical protein
MPRMAPQATRVAAEAKFFAEKEKKAAAGLAAAERAAAERAAAEQEAAVTLAVGLGRGWVAAAIEDWVCSQEAAARHIQKAARHHHDQQSVAKASGHHPRKNECIIS